MKRKILTTEKKKDTHNYIYLCKHIEKNTAYDGTSPGVQAL